MFTYYQVYILHLLDGTKIELAEEYDIPEEKGLLGCTQKLPLTKSSKSGIALPGFLLFLKEILCMYPRLVL